MKLAGKKARELQTLKSQSCKPESDHDDLDSAGRTAETLWSEAEAVLYQDSVTTLRPFPPTAIFIQYIFNIGTVVQFKGNNRLQWLKKRIIFP